MDGGEQLGRRLFFLDSGATEECEDEKTEHVCAELKYTLKSDFV
jgi:hypothetical protein